MTSTPTFHCYLGTIGWDHETWVGSFYPESLPAEWRLSFYNTHFDCVFLPYHDWGTRSVEDMAVWRGDTLERFRFLLEHPPAAPSHDDRHRIDALTAKAVPLGPETKAQVVWFDAASDLRSLATRLREGVARNEVLYVISVDADQARLAEVRTLLDVLGY
jgi:uncharacterized protein YecE (DUF72 family)